jgi:hypothetical protein
LRHPLTYARPALLAGLLAHHVVNWGEGHHPRRVIQVLAHTSRDWKPAVHAGYTRSRQVGECNGHQRAPPVVRNRRPAGSKAATRQRFSRRGRVRVSPPMDAMACQRFARDVASACHAYLRVAAWAEPVDLGERGGTDGEAQGFEVAARAHGMQGVRGSNPLSSTRHNATSTPALSAICQRFASRLRTGRVVGAGPAWLIQSGVHLDLAGLSAEGAPTRMPWAWLAEQLSGPLMRPVCGIGPGEGRLRRAGVAGGFPGRADPGRRRSSRAWPW